MATIRERDLKLIAAAAALVSAVLVVDAAADVSHIATEADCCTKWVGALKSCCAASAVITEATGTSVPRRAKYFRIRATARLTRLAAADSEMPMAALTSSMLRPWR